jgi:hypothetical protein
MDVRIEDIAALPVFAEVSHAGHHHPQRSLLPQS